MDPTGKVALVTGASRGVGAAAALALARTGAAVACAARSTSDAPQRTPGSLDILVNNAAITFVGDLYVPMRRHDLMMDVNLRAPLLAIRDAAPAMAKRGGGSDHSSWEPPEVAAEGILWMIRQPATYSGRRESMYALREREGIMPSRAERPAAPELPPLELFDGLATTRQSMFPKEPL